MDDQQVLILHIGGQLLGVGHGGSQSLLHALGLGDDGDVAVAVAVAHGLDPREAAHDGLAHGDTAAAGHENEIVDGAHLVHPQLVALQPVNDLFHGRPLLLQLQSVHDQKTHGPRHTQGVHAMDAPLGVLGTHPLRGTHRHVVGGADLGGNGHAQHVDPRLGVLLEVLVIFLGAGGSGADLHLAVAETAVKVLAGDDAPVQNGFQVAAVADADVAVYVVGHTEILADLGGEIAGHVGENDVGIHRFSLLWGFGSTVLYVGRLERILPHCIHIPLQYSTTRAVCQSTKVKIRRIREKNVEGNAPKGQKKTEAA